MSDIDWTNASCQVTDHFTVKDCLWLHEWNRLATSDDGVDLDQVLATAQMMETIRTALGCPISVHCMFRSTAYNIEQKILLPTGKDVHSMSIACDFDCNSTMSIQDVKDKLEPQLESLVIRMERGTTTWVHCDSRAPGPSGRYFTP